MPLQDVQAGAGQVFPSQCGTAVVWGDGSLVFHCSGGFWHTGGTRPLHLRRERERVRSQCVYSEISALTNQESLNSVSTNKVSVFFKKPKNSIIPCEKHYFRLQFWCWAQGEINRGCLEVMWQLRQDELEQVAPDMHQPGSVSLHRGQSGRGYAPCLRAEVSYVVSVHTSCADQADICDTRRSAHTLHRRDALSVSYLQQAARTC